MSGFRFAPVVLLMLVLAPVGAGQNSRTRMLSCVPAAGGLGANTVSDRLPVPAGNPANEGYLREARLLNARLHVHARLMYSPTLNNALADPDTDEVVLGLVLQRQAEQQARLYGPSVVNIGMGWIMCHEFGHVFQFRMSEHDLSKLPRYTPHTELQADILGAYYMGGRMEEQREEAQRNEAWVTSQAGAMFMMARNLGDYAFFSNSHHGTPDQRTEAVRIGYEAGHDQKFGTLEEAYSDNAEEIFKWSLEEAKRIAPHREPRTTPDTP